MGLCDRRDSQQVRKQLTSLSLSSRTGGWVATIGKAERRRGNNCRPCGRCRPLKPAISFTLWQNERILRPRELHFDGNITNRGFQAILDAFLLRQQLGENAAPNVLEQTTKAVDFFAKHVSVNFPRWPRFPFSVHWNKKLPVILVCCDCQRGPIIFRFCAALQNKRRQ